MARGTKKSPIEHRSYPKHSEKILAALRGIGRPASAYDIQAELAKREHLAPQTIYRALERLIKEGSVHRVESLHAFVACAHGCCHGPFGFAICEQCGSVTELQEPGLDAIVQDWSQSAGFSVTETALELHGVCAICSSGDRL